MASTIELRAFMGLRAVFKERDWPIPFLLDISKDKITGQDLLLLLNISQEQVEVIFINGKAFIPSQAIINGGDRVALVPPGTPGPYRLLLGFVDLSKKKNSKDSQ